MRVPWGLLFLKERIEERTLKLQKQDLIKDMVKTQVKVEAGKQEAGEDWAGVPGTADAGVAAEAAEENDKNKQSKRKWQK